MKRPVVLCALVALSCLGTSGCAWFFKQADQSIELTPAVQQRDGRMATFANQHDCWVDLTYRSLADGNFDAAPFKRTRGEATRDATGSVWTITGENLAGKVTKLVFRLGDPALTVGTKFGVTSADGGVPVPPPTATVALSQGVGPGGSALQRGWVATPRAEALELAELGPADRALLIVDLAFAPGTQGPPASKGTFSLKGSVTVYNLRPLAHRDLLGLGVGL